MAKPSEKLADSLEHLHELQRQGRIAIRSSELTRTHRERLVQSGFLQEVMKGWYVPARPDETAGESTAWYASFWDFCTNYLNEKKGTKWCLSPEQSISIHVENWAVPQQLLVRASKARNKVTSLPHETSLLEIGVPLPQTHEIEVQKGLRLFTLPAAIIACSPRFYHQNPTDMRAALSMVKDSSDILNLLLDGGHSTVAGRLVGAFINIGRNEIANEIINTMRTAGYDVRVTDPFESNSPILFSEREYSPYVNRIRLMWQEMRENVIEHFPPSPGLPKKKKAYLKKVEEIYTTDAYHSLSIEGYRVSHELIEQVRSGSWDSATNHNDSVHMDALAARGYWQAFQVVNKSVEKVLNGGNPGEVLNEEHRYWYREMFAPSVSAGIIKASDLAGYRNAPVYIRKSKHVPPSKEAVRDSLPAFFDLIANEPEGSVRVVLGHFIFVFIHPYMDGNGRMGRFIMNLMMASGGYPWTIVPIEKRHEYMAALEEASVHKNIIPFTTFIAELLHK